MEENNAPIKDYLKSANLTQPLIAFKNEISIEDLNRIMNELGNKIEPPPFKPIPIPYAIATIDNI